MSETLRLHLPEVKVAGEKPSVSFLAGEHLGCCAVLCCFGLGEDVDLRLLGRIEATTGAALAEYLGQSGRQSDWAENLVYGEAKRFRRLPTGIVSYAMAAVDITKPAPAVTAMNCTSNTGILVPKKCIAIPNPYDCPNDREEVGGYRLYRNPEPVARVVNFSLTPGVECKISLGPEAHLRELAQGASPPDQNTQYGSIEIS